MENRHERIVGASIAGVVINLVFVGLKTLIGVLSGSVSVVVDAVNNGTDVLSALVTLAGVKLARRKPDKEHPHGHGRVEYIAAIGVGLIILAVGIGAALASVPKISRPEVANYSALSIVVISATVIVKLVFGRYLRKVGKVTRSRSLEGTGVDAMFDAALSFGTLVGAVVSMLFNVSIDGIIGVVIAAFIVKSAIEIISEAMGDLIGRRADERLVRRVRDVIRGVEGVKGVPKLVLHDYGPEDVSGAVKIEVNPKMTVRELTEITEEIEKRVLEELDVKLIVGV
ncbi:cation transporter [Candidatus Saccharibacteria bacterium]|nr:cation transporter [Candidatus Saccharibacteria bacterium]MBR6122757.1 cation transporter [Candidatus Saccharibacteria bacterium]